MLRNKVFWLIVLFSSYCDLSKIIRVNHEILGCIILAKAGPNFWFAPKWIFCENWLMLFLSTFCALSHYKVSKKILIAAHEIHGCIIFCQIGPKLSIHTNKEVFGNIDCFFCLPITHYHTWTSQKNTWIENWYLIILENFIFKLLSSITGADYKIYLNIYTWLFHWPKHSWYFTQIHIK